VLRRFGGACGGVKTLPGMLILRFLQGNLAFFVILRWLLMADRCIWLKPTDEFGRYYIRHVQCETTRFGFGNVRLGSLPWCNSCISSAPFSTLTSFFNSLSLDQFWVGLLIRQSVTRGSCESHGINGTCIVTTANSSARFHLVM